MKREVLVQEMAEMLGISIEEADAAVPKHEKPAPLKESIEERLMEAQATLNYFLYRGRGTFYKVTCTQCGLLFAYDYNYLGITKCSIECMSQALEAIGLKWTPNKPLEERWGYRAAPAVVPAQVLGLIQELSGEETVNQQNESDYLTGNSSLPGLINSPAKLDFEELDLFLADLDL